MFLQSKWSGIPVPTVYRISHGLEGLKTVLWIRIRTRIKLKGRIRIRILIKVLSWIWIRINLQMTSQNLLWNMSLFKHFFKV